MRGKKFEIEHVTLLYATDGGASVSPFIEVGAYAEIPDFLEIRTTTSQSKEYFGSINLTLAPDKAIQLANAIIHIAQKIKENTNEQSS